mmetsp:Transcript_52083/g.60843  ORF Transcript_52083/g.60843 Transcript_52083/m.60843 type:complete len:286 (-) Transcript_52083:156-1013(-)|eukprot:CAMPEP_0194378350 /NCGR_PEP_ID=MMETSP0174-20130528/34673_1 /TAXON_ID=216777 /ORGANISM="Proboscia alata, Strain PI-D3" /LENGTH=285 /DNA_ID=CAMNT_0039160275 /DNA_START=262 /DNA_END=1119 /DNA_ORIENTATION=+
MADITTRSNMFSVAGKKVLVTGGSRGIGYMIAKGFAQQGAHVLLTSRDAKACEEATSSIGHGCQYIVSNLSSRQGCEELADNVSRHFSKSFDVLINNAGTSWGEEAYDRESGKANWGFDKILDLNLKSVFYLSRACMPLLQRENLRENRDGIISGKNDPGRIINVGSISGFLSQEAPTHAYDTSKAAVHHLTKKMSADLAHRNITVNAIAPGYVMTRMSAGLTKYVSGTEEKLAKSIPLGRFGNDDDMAGSCIYLSSPAASWITGVILTVDGGAVGAMQIPLSSL